MRARSGPKPVTPASLDAAAAAYLERFASSAANLRRVLQRRLRRAAEDGPGDAEAGARMIDAVVERFVRAGLLDDRAYAEAKSASLHRRGASARAIAAKLAGQGVARDLIGAALGEADDAAGLAARPGGDLAAAVVLARRRKLGPFRPPATREAHRLKDLGTLARAGFARAIAERVLAADDPDALDEILHAPA